MPHVGWPKNFSAIPAAVRGSTAQPTAEMGSSPHVAPPGPAASCHGAIIGLSQPVIADT
jgi:hypothetical protein